MKNYFSSPRFARIVLYSVFCYGFFWVKLQSQTLPNADDMFAAVQKKYADGSSMRVKFFMKNENLRGSLALKRGNKYILEIAGRTIISNGALVWNYDANERKVIISEFRDNPDNISPERLFMNFPRGYKPQLSAGDAAQEFILTLLPAKPRDQISDMQRVDLRLRRERRDKNDIQLKEIVVFDGLTRHEWEILDIKPDAGLTDNAFEWKPPAGTQIIDLRD
jgi:outer membrane lipoprotein-sorting protein